MNYGVHGASPSILATPDDAKSVSDLSVSALIESARRKAGLYTASLQEARKNEVTSLQKLEEERRRFAMTIEAQNTQSQEIERELQHTIDAMRENGPNDVFNNYIANGSIPPGSALLSSMSASPPHLSGYNPSAAHFTASSIPLGVTSQLSSSALQMSSHSHSHTHPAQLTFNDNSRQGLISSNGGGVFPSGSQVMDTLQSFELENKRLAKELMTKTGECDSLITQLNSISTINRQLNALKDQLSNALNDSNGKLQFRQSQVLEYEKDKENMNRSAAEMSRTIDSLQSQIKLHKNELAISHAELRQAIARVTTLEKEITELHSFGLDRERHQKITEIAKLETAESKARELTRNIDVLRQQHQALADASLAEKAAAERRINELENENLLLTSELNLSKNEVKNINAQLHSSNMQLASNASIISELESINKLLTAKKDIQNISAQSHVTPIETSKSDKNVHNNSHNDNDNVIKSLDSSPSRKSSSANNNSDNNKHNTSGASENAPSTSSSSVPVSSSNDLKTTISGGQSKNLSMSSVAKTVINANLAIKAAKASISDKADKVVRRSQSNTAATPSKASIDNSLATESALKQQKSVTKSSDDINGAALRGSRDKDIKEIKEVKEVKPRVGSASSARVVATPIASSPAVEASTQKKKKAASLTESSSSKAPSGTAAPVISKEKVSSIRNNSNGSASNMFRGGDILDLLEVCDNDEKPIDNLRISSQSGISVSSAASAASDLVGSNDQINRIATSIDYIESSDAMDNSSDEHTEVSSSSQTQTPGSQLTRGSATSPRSGTVVSGVSSKKQITNGNKQSSVVTERGRRVGQSSSVSKSATVAPIASSSSNKSTKAPLISKKPAGNSEYVIETTASKFVVNMTIPSPTSGASDNLSVSKSEAVKQSDDFSKVNDCDLSVQSLGNLSDTGVGIDDDNDIRRAISDVSTTSGSRYTAIATSNPAARRSQSATPSHSVKSNNQGATSGSNSSKSITNKRQTSMALKRV